MPTVLTSLSRFLRLPAALLALVVALAPAAAHADGEQPGPPPTPSAPANEGRTLAASVSASVQSAADHVLQSAQQISDSALDLIGVRYKFGGESPDKGLDCSGLVRYVFEQVTGVTLPHSARVRCVPPGSIRKASIC